METVDKIAPYKMRIIASDDQPWFDENLKVLDKKRRREFTKNRRSQRYRKLNQEFKAKCSKSEKNFFQKMTQQVK